MPKNYLGCCGTCQFCDLSESTRFGYDVSFKCKRNNYWVKANEKTCNRFEPDRSRNNELIGKYEK